MGILSVAIRLAALGDSKELLKRAVSLLRKQFRQNDGEHPRDYNARLEEMARSGEGIYSQSVYDAIDSMSSNVWPTVGKYFFIRWVADQIQSSGNVPATDQILLVKDYFMSEGSSEGLISGKVFEDVYGDAQDWHAEVGDEYKSEVQGYISDPAKTLFDKIGSVEIHKISNENLTEEEIKNDLDYEGSRMRICVGKFHASDVIRGVETIYSFRENGMPRVTVSQETHSNEFVEIKGNSNRQVTDPKYVAVLVEFFTKNFQPLDYVKAETRWFLTRAPIETLREIEPDVRKMNRYTSDIHQVVEAALEFRGKLDSCKYPFDKAMVFSEGFDSSSDAFLMAKSILNTMDTNEILEMLREYLVPAKMLVRNIYNKNILREISKHPDVMKKVGFTNNSRVIGVLKGQAKTSFANSFLDNMSDARRYDVRIHEFFNSADKEVALRNAPKLARAACSRFIYSKLVDEQIREKVALSAIDYFLSCDPSDFKYQNMGLFVFALADMSIYKSDPVKFKDILINICNRVTDTKEKTEMENSISQL